MIRGTPTISIPDKIPVGASLLAKASVHSTPALPDTPLSRAGSLLQWSGAHQQSPSQPKSLWERACSRRRRYIQHLHCLTHRFREQARSHNDPGHTNNLHPNQNPCGSGLAREGVGTFNTCIACNTAFASRLTPTMIRGTPTISIPTKIPVGASLLAKASVHSTPALPDTPLSRAGSLLQRSGAHQRSPSQTKSLWERACSRRRRHIQHHHHLTHRFREQARSYNDPGQDHNLGRSENPCGSGLAREGVGTFNTCIAWTTAFASRLAPTMIRGKSMISIPSKIPVGLHVNQRAKPI